MTDDSPGSEPRHWGRRSFIGVLLCVVFISLFYAEENWRGKRAWENCRRELVSRGIAVDWAAFIPPPMSDDNNIFSAPNMALWFIGRGATPLSTRLNYTTLTNTDYRDITNHTGRILLADVTVAGAGSSPPTSNLQTLLDFDSPGAKAAAEKLLRDVIGRQAIAPQGFTFLASPLSKVRPATIRLAMNRPVPAYEFTNLFTFTPVSYFPAISAQKKTGLEVEDAGSNVFHVWLKPPLFYTAQEYLDWSDQFEPEFATIREALKRPYARMYGDYEQSFSMPIPNFITVRVVAQALCARAQCNLMLGHPDAALPDLTLVHDLCRLLEARPTGKPMTLVAAMINVAVTGLYLQIVAQGFDLHAWQEPHLVVLQRQLAEIDLLPLLASALTTERAAVCHAFETIPIRQLMSPSLLYPGGPPPTPDPWEGVKVLPYAMVPRGWVYQNMVTLSFLLDKTFECFDVSNRVISPSKALRAADEANAALGHFSPNSFLAGRGLANYAPALRTLGFQQTMAYEALLACALERYRLAHGTYPESLAALCPQLIAKLPHDIIGGQPLKYRLNPDGGFIIYSIGWNEKDDNGKTVLKSGAPPSADMERGDWVWPPPSMESKL